MQFKLVDIFLIKMKDIEFILVNKAIMLSKEINIPIILTGGI